MKTQSQLQENVTELKVKLRNINERVTNPMASDETVRELLKTKNELIADLQTAEIELDKLKNPPKPFERSLNESPEL